MVRLTDTQVDDLTRSERPWNIARRVFERHTAIISKMIDECESETPAECARANVAIRRAQFEAVSEIGRALGMMIADLGSGEATPGADPEGLRKWLSGAPETGLPEGAGKAPGLRSTAPAGKLPLGPENVVTGLSGRAPYPPE